MESINLKLSSEQARFALMIESYPKLSSYWDFGIRKCNVELILSDMNSFSHGEKILAQFFLSVWTHENYSFDVVDAAATLSDDERLLIANWVNDPFWP